MDKTIVTAAITGAIHTPTMSPFLPLTGSQIIEEIIAVHEAGGAIAHVHARDEQSGLPNSDQDVYRRIGEEVKRHWDIVICFTTGGRLGESVENRVRVVSNLHPELASLNAGSLNFALFHVADRVDQWKEPWEKGYLEATEDFIFPNTFRTMREFLTIFRSKSTKPEFEIYDVGMINNLAYLIGAGHADEPVHLQFVMGILGGIPATCENLMFLLNTAQKSIGRFTWSVCAAGRAQFLMCTQALLLGGHVRVGLEDNLYLEKGVIAKSNAEQVSKIIRIMKELGNEPATPEEARTILGLKGLDKVNY
jgi:3,5-dioxohexanoate:acetyl-CoA acetone transferase